jgi:hypothetical protein
MRAMPASMHVDGTCSGPRRSTMFSQQERGLRAGKSTLVPRRAMSFSFQGRGVFATRLQLIYNFEKNFRSQPLMRGIRRADARAKWRVGLQPTMDRSSIIDHFRSRCPASLLDDSIRVIITSTWERERERKRETSAWPEVLDGLWKYNALQHGVGNEMKMRQFTAFLFLFCLSW